MTSTEFEYADERREIERIIRWRLDELRQAGYEDSAALAIAADTEIDLHLATNLLRRGYPPGLAGHILL